MNIGRTKGNLIVLLTLFSLITGWIGAFVVNKAFPEQYFDGYPFIPVYFYLFGMLNIYVLDVCRKRAPRKLVLIHLALKVARILASIIFMVIYCLVVQEEIRVFLLTFIVFYLIFLIYETCITAFVKGNETGKEKKIN